MEKLLIFLQHGIVIVVERTGETKTENRAKNATP